MACGLRSRYCLLEGLGAVATESLGAAVSSNCSWGALDGLDRGSCDGRPLVLYYNLEFASGTSGRATVSILSRTFSWECHENASNLKLPLVGMI